MTLKKWIMPRNRQFSQIFLVTSKFVYFYFYVDTFTSIDFDSHPTYARLQSNI